MSKDDEKGAATETLVCVCWGGGGGAPELQSAGAKYTSALILCHETSGNAILGGHGVSSGQLIRRGLTNFYLRRRFSELRGHSRSSNEESDEEQSLLPTPYAMGE